MTTEIINPTESDPFLVLVEYLQLAESRQKIVDKYQEIIESYLAFSAGDKHYLLNMQVVQEVSTDLHEITPLPFTPAWLLGLGGARGDVFSVVDFKRFIDPTASAKTSKTVGFIILRNEGQGYVLKVDAIHGIRSCEVSQFQSSRNWLDGQAAMEGRQWFRIDLGRLVTDASFIQNMS